MPMNILGRVEAGPLPMRFVERDDIDHLQDLRDAGYVRLRFDISGRICTGATVIAITSLGRLAMCHFGPTAPGSTGP